MDFPKSVSGVGLVNGKFVDEDEQTGQQGSLIPAAWGNMTTDELLAVIIEAGLVPSEIVSNQLLLAIKKLVGRAPAVSGVRGLRGDRNAVTPTTKYDFTCAQRIYRNPATGDTIISRSAATISADVAVAGPVAGGRDQVAAFAAGWLNLFFLIDAAGNETAVWSTNAPTVGPNMFGTYVSWVFGHSVYWTGTGIRRCAMRGARYFEAIWQSVLTSGNTGGAEVSANCATAWPAWAQLGITRIKSSMGTNAGGGGAATASWRFLSGFASKDIDMACTLINDVSYYAEECVFPNVGQQILCAVTLTSSAANISSVSTQLQAVGFTVSNGDS